MSRKARRPNAQELRELCMDTVRAGLNKSRLPVPPPPSPQPVLPQLPPTKAQLTILLLQDGNLQVRGALENRLVAYGLLSWATAVLDDYYRVQDEKAKKLAVPTQEQVAEVNQVAK